MFLEILNALSDFFWGYTLILLLIGTGSILTIRLFFIQIRYFFYGLLLTFGYQSEGRLTKPSIIGDISPFQALSTALSATIGVGNIVGVAGALLVAGPGALFWMWVVAFIGMATKYSEAVLAMLYRENTPTGYAGGPMYYIEKGLKAKPLAIFFSVVTLFTSFGIGNMLQANAAVSTFNGLDRSMSILLTSILSIFTGIVILGGIKRIGKVTTYLVSIMSLFYIVGCCYILFININQIPNAFLLIVKYAFEPLPIAVGSFGGFLLITIRTGVQRGLFSNEAGLGSAPMADASSTADHPVKQGLVSMIGPFFDTIVMCTLTGLVVIIGVEQYGLEILKNSAIGKSEYIINQVSTMPQDNSNIWVSIINHLGNNVYEIQANLTTAVFHKYMGIFGSFIVNISILLFATATIIGWFHYSDRALVYLGGEKYTLGYKVIWIMLTFIGGTIGQADIIWKISNISNAIMAFPNLLALLILMPVVLKQTKDFFTQYPHRYDIFSHCYLVILKILPKSKISKLLGIFAKWQAPRFIMQPILLAYSKAFNLNLDEAELELKNYKSLNTLFTRALKNEARVIENAKNIIVSPVDGRILNFGKIAQGSLIQAKGMEFTLEDMLSDKLYYNNFIDGHWMTIYLSPQDYHRIHSPVDADIIGYSYRPGRLFPVNHFAVSMVKNLFSKNERLVTYLQTQHGLIALVKVGATVVGEIKVTYDETITSNKWVRKGQDRNYNQAISIQKGAELGRFQMGSTVILLFEKDTIDFLDFEEKDKLLFGQPIAIFKNHSLKSKINILSKGVNVSEASADLKSSIKKVDKTKVKVKASVSDLKSSIKKVDKTKVKASVSDLKSSIKKVDKTKVKASVSDLKSNIKKVDKTKVKDSVSDLKSNIKKVDKTKDKK